MRDMVLLTLAVTTSLALPAQTPLPAWTPGTLDIHQIATGRGNAALFVFPDGTTLLVDAGAAGDGLPESDPHPDASRTPMRITWASCARLRRPIPAELSNSQGSPRWGMRSLSVP